MSYREILFEQSRKLGRDRQWWPKYFYHFTDVHNAVGILYDGKIYSRKKADELGKMQLDNASKAVIENTDKEAYEYARMFFRPTTPTQYHNEGYKPLPLRNSSVNASCPVPVFFMLDSVSVLESPGTFFVEKGLAGHGNLLEQGEESFSKLQFDKIYHVGRSDKLQGTEIKKYRASEIVVKDELSIWNHLKYIVCRSEAEREMLFFLLRERNIDLYKKIRYKILYSPRIDCFECNGVFIRNVDIKNQTLDIDFNDKSERIRDSAEFMIDVTLEFYDADNEFLGSNAKKFKVDFMDAAGVQMPLNIPNEAYTMRVLVKFDEAEMYENKILLGNEIVI